MQSHPSWILENWFVHTHSNLVPGKFVSQDCPSLIPENLLVYTIHSGSWKAGFYQPVHLQSYLRSWKNIIPSSLSILDPEDCMIWNNKSKQRNNKTETENQFDRSRQLCTRAFEYNVFLFHILSVVTAQTHGQLCPFTKGQ